MDPQRAQALRQVADAAEVSRLLQPAGEDQSS
jgi:hypothetical protein